MSSAQHYCKHQSQADLQRSDGRRQQPEIANIADNEGRGGQEHTQAAADQAENSRSTPATASIWQDGLRIDNRDRISASDSRPAFGPTRIRLFVTATVLLALGCGGRQSGADLKPRKLLSSKAMVVNVAEKSERDFGRIEKGERKRTADDVSKAD
jgi:hypothetical protein